MQSEINLGMVGIKKEITSLSLMCCQSIIEKRLGISGASIATEQPDCTNPEVLDDKHCIACPLVMGLYPRCPSEVLQLRTFCYVHFI